MVCIQAFKTLDDTRPRTFKTSRVEGVDTHSLLNATLFYSELEASHRSLCFLWQELIFVPKKDVANLPRSLVAESFATPVLSTLYEKWRCLHSIDRSGVDDLEIQIVLFTLQVARTSCPWRRVLSCFVSHSSYFLFSRTMPSRVRRWPWVCLFSHTPAWFPLNQKSCCFLTLPLTSELDVWKLTHYIQIVKMLDSSPL